MVSESTDRKRARILAAASRLFLLYGIRRTSIDDVAREAEIAKGTVYLYYASKEALNAAVAQAFCDDALDAARAALEAPGALAQRVAGFLDAWKGAPSRLIASSPHTAELIESRATLPAAIFNTFDANMRDALRGALQAGGIETSDAVEMLYAAAVGMLETGERNERFYRTRLAAMVEVMLTGLRSRG